MKWYFWKEDELGGFYLWDRPHKHWKPADDEWFDWATFVEDIKNAEYVSDVFGINYSEESMIHIRLKTRREV